MRRMRNCCAWNRNGERLEETGSKERREVADGNGTDRERKRHKGEEREIGKLEE